MIYNQYITISVYYPSELFQKSSLSALYLLLFPYFKPGLLQPSSNWSPCDSFLSTLVHFPWCLCDPLKSLVISLSHIKKFGGDLLNRPGGPHSSFSSLYFYLWPSLDILLCILSTPVLQSSLYSVHNDSLTWYAWTYHDVLWKLLVLLLLSNSSSDFYYFLILQGICH